MNIRWTLINMTNSLDLKILQITWNVPNWRNEFSWTEIEFLEVIAEISDIYVAVPIKIINMKYFGT